MDDHRLAHQPHALVNGVSRGHAPGVDASGSLPGPNLAKPTSYVQIDLTHHQGWLELVAPTAASADGDLVIAARRDAGAAMSSARLEKPVNNDARDGMFAAASVGSA